MTAAQSPPVAAPAGPAAGEHNTGQAVIDAAIALAALYRTTPDLRRLRPEVRQLVEAVDAHDRAVGSCLSCGAADGEPGGPNCEFR